MQTFEAIKKRRAIRKFKDKEIEQEKIDKILEAGMWAPSAMNTQPWKFLVIKDRKNRKWLRQLYDETRKNVGAYKQETDFVEKAITIIVLSEKKGMMGEISCSLAVQNMLLAATDLGLGSNVLGCYQSLPENLEKIRKKFSIPENLEFITFIVIGYADENPEPKPRKVKGETAYYEKFPGGL